MKPSLKLIKGKRVNWQLWLTLTLWAIAMSYTYWCHSEQQEFERETIQIVTKIIQFLSGGH